MTTYLEAELVFIQPSPTNPRKSFPAEEMAEMVDSVSRHGVLQPVLVRYWPNNYTKPRPEVLYELVAGERRYRAAKGAGLASIPIMLRTLTDNEVLEIQIIENLQRKGLHPIEEAESYALMINDHGYTADQLAEKIGKSRAYIYGRMKLAALTTPARLAFRDGNLTASTALLIARIPGEALQAKALDKITKSYRGVLSYRDAAEVIQREFCMHLDDAKFPQENLMLVPSAGACTSCPKRSGNAPELFPDIARADVCTDPECHQAKTKAWLAYQKAQAIEAGKTVISGAEAEKINIAYSHDKYMPLDRKNYELDGAPTYRETVSNTNVEIVLIEDQRTGTLVEAVERKALASALVEAGIKPERDHREEERALERKAREENKYRQRLFAAWHNTMQAQLADDETPYLETEELALVAGLLWSNLYSESAETVMGFWAKPSEKKEHWERRNEMMREVASKIDVMSRRDLVLFLMDCALASDGRASIGTVDKAPERLIAHARACGIDPDEIKRQIEAEKAEKSSKSKTAKTTSTPKKAPLVGAADCDEKNGPAEIVFVTGSANPIKEDGRRFWAIAEGVPVIGSRVRVKDDAKGTSGQRRKCCGREGVVEAMFTNGTRFAVRFGDKKDVVADLRRDEIDLLLPSTETISTPSEAALAAGPDSHFRQMIKAEYAHPENSELTWTGRGRKPKWVENWLTEGGTLDQLRIHPASANNSAAHAAEVTNKTCAAERVERCTKTLDLPLV